MHGGITSVFQLPQRPNASNVCRSSRLAGVHIYVRRPLWTRPALTLIAAERHPISAETMEKRDVLQLANFAIRLTVQDHLLRQELTRWSRDTP